MISTHYQYLVEIDAWNGSGVETIKFCGNEQFAAGWLPYLQDPSLKKQSMFQGGKTYGSGQYEFGEIVVSNYAEESVSVNDGPLDYLKTYAFDGREFRVLRGLQSDAYGSFVLEHSGVIESVRFDWYTISFSLRSFHTNLEETLDTGTFLGNNVLPAGVEGNADDLEGRAKPVLFGRVFNAEPVLCNTSKLIYAVSPATGIDRGYMGSEFRVYDSGVILAFDGYYASQAAMEATQPAQGTFMVWEAGGYFRLGAAPVGTITFSGASNGRSMTGHLKNLLVDVLAVAGETALVSANTTSDLAAIFTASPVECGFYASGEVSVIDVIDALCSAYAVYWYFDNDNAIRLSQFIDPSGMTASHTITSLDGVENFAISKINDTEGGTPAHRVVLKYARNYTPSLNTAGYVSPHMQARFDEEWRSATVENAGILTTHPYSKELVIETTLTKEPTTELTRRFNLYSVNRELVSFTVPLGKFIPNKAQIGQCFDVTLNDRFDFTNKKMVAIDVTYNYASDEVSLVLWG